MDKKSAIIKKVQAKVRLAEEKKNFIGKIEEFLKDSKEEATTLQSNYLPDIKKMYHDIVELAEEKYEKGQDYYGSDYIAQKMDRKLMSKVSEGLDEINYLWDIREDLKKVKSRFESMLRDLRED